MQAAVVDPRIVGWLLGQFVAALAVVMLIPLGYSLLSDSADLRALALSAAITGIAGGLLLALSRTRQASAGSGFSANHRVATSGLSSLSTSPSPGGQWSCGRLARSAR